MIESHLLKLNIKMNGNVIKVSSGRAVLYWFPQVCMDICEITTLSHVIMGAIASQITSLTIVYSIVYSDADQRKHQSSASLAFVRGIHRGPVNSPHKWPVTRKMFPFDDVIMLCLFVGHCDTASVSDWTRLRHRLFNTSTNQHLNLSWLELRRTFSMHNYQMFTISKLII